MALRILLVLLFVMTASSTLISGQSNSKSQQVKDSTEQWNQAKAKYSSQMAKLREEVLARIATLEKKARDAGDLGKVKTLKAAAEDFADGGDLPSVIDKADHARKQKRAQEELRRDSKLVIAALLKEKLDVEAEDVAQELKDLIEPQNSSESSTDAAPVDESRKRFVNTSYHNVVFHIRGKEWGQSPDGTGKLTWRLNEVGRDKDYIYLYLPERRQNWRLGLKTIDLQQPNNSWTWLSHGYWENADGK